MKRFIRTIAGKTTLFLGFILSLCILVGCMVGAIAMLKGDAYYYTHSEQEITEAYMKNQLMSEAFSAVWDTVENNNHSDVSEGILYEVLDDSGKTLCHSENAVSTNGWQYTFTFGVLQDGGGAIIDIYPLENYNRDTAKHYTVHMTALENCKYTSMLEIVHAIYTMRYAIYVIGILAGILTIYCYVGLMSGAGRRPDCEELVTGPLNRIPYDIMVFIWLVMACIGLIFLDEANGTGVFEIIIWGCVGVYECALFLGISICSAIRIKQRSIFRNTVIYRLGCLLGKAMKKIIKGSGSLAEGLPLIWKTVFVLSGLTVLEFLGICVLRYRPVPMLLCFILEKIVLIPVILYIVFCLRKLQQGGRALAAGDLSYVTDTSSMRWDLKEHGDNLNSIAGGMTIAVEDRLRSERMKTELITNVSHDLKTPLTSIINYATLIGGEETENEKITEYAQVLVRQSHRLKRLIEDLVEASKASTGNLDCHLAPCDASVFLDQAAGEYEEKLQKANLTLVTKQPEKEIWIMADGRRMWRVFDNLMNNICKYAQEGTRVYLSLEQQDYKAVITFKNTSRDALDMTEAELMERFTRGDSSRHTEGNGLGLSIARSMAQLQSGELNLQIDGDLFKAILTFPVIKLEH